MRLTIEFDEKYEDQFYELVIATGATLVAEGFESWDDYPEHVKSGIQKSLEQARNCQTKTYDEVKKMLAERFPEIEKGHLKI